MMLASFKRCKIISQQGMRILSTWITISHSAAKNSGRVGFILNHHAREAWSAAGDLVLYHEINGVTRIGLYIFNIRPAESPPT